MKFDGAVVLVAGGASGLGEASVRRAHGAGARLVIADLDGERGARLAHELGDAVRFLQTDITRESAAEAAVELAVTEFGAVHVLINCAGVSPAERVLGRAGPHRLDGFARCIEINLVGSFNMLRLAAAAMARNQSGADGERGVIINTASIAAFEGQIGQAAYAASKAGVVGMTLPIARELARHRIRVLTIAPGLFVTPMLTAMPQQVQESLARTACFPQRLGHADEFAALVQHMVENEMLNGTTVRLDGAVRLPAKA